MLPGWIRERRDSTWPKRSNLGTVTYRCRKRFVRRTHSRFCGTGHAEPTASEWRGAQWRAGDSGGKNFGPGTVIVRCAWRMWTLTPQLSDYSVCEHRDSLLRLNPNCNRVDEIGYDPEDHIVLAVVTTISPATAAAALRRRAATRMCPLCLPTATRFWARSCSKGPEDWNNRYGRRNCTDFL